MKTRLSHQDLKTGASISCLRNVLSFAVTTIGLLACSATTDNPSVSSKPLETVTQRIGGQSQPISGTNYHADLRGDEEFPSGTPGSTGSADVIMDHDRGTICYTFNYSGMKETPIAHIHRGDIGVQGPLVVDIHLDQSGPIGCAPAEKTVIPGIAQDPAGYYVELHTTERERGVIRGQLRPTSR